jgi:predicted GNAT family acetyltransferase
MMNVDLDKVMVENNTAAKRFEAVVDGQRAMIEYGLMDGSIVFTHTEVPPALEGHGLASKMAHTALEYARAQQLSIVPLCPFVTSYLRRHPEYHTLVEPAYRERVQRD